MQFGSFVMMAPVSIWYLTALSERLTPQSIPQPERNAGDSPSIYFAPGIDFAN